MQLDPLKIERTEWKTKDMRFLFKKLQPLFPQLIASDLVEIDRKIADDAVEYFEIAHYLQNEIGHDVPSSILVFQNNRVFYDIVDLEKKSLLVEKFKELSGEVAHFVKARKITKSELQKRILALLESEVLPEFEEDSEEDDNDLEDVEDDLFAEEPAGFVGKDTQGVLDRSAFHLVAKSPVLNWLRACQEKATMRNFSRDEIVWSLELINREPAVFLMPSEIDLWPENQSTEAWRQAKKSALKNFVWSYYTDDSFWPEHVDERLFDQWFDIKPLGMVWDIADDDE